MKSLKLNKIMGLTLMAVLLAACASTPPATPEQTVEQRAEARWGALLGGEFEQAWEYYSPGFRQTNSQARFVESQERRPVIWTKAEVLGAQCAEDTCSVTTEITYRVRGGPTGTSSMRMNREIIEQWIRIDGQWWYVQN